MRLIAMRPFSYAGRRLKAGDAFDAREADGKAYKAIRYAADPPPPKPAPKAEAKAEPEAAPEPEKPAPDRSSSYRTRRLKADDD